MNPSTSADAQPTETQSLTLVRYLLTINRAYKESIDDKLKSLKQKLELNRKQQNDLFTEITNINNSKTLSVTKNDEPVKRNENELTKIKFNYFKDRFGSEPDQNVDTLQKNKLNIRDCIPQCNSKQEWTLEHRETLKNAVLKDSLRVLKLPFTSKVVYLEEKLFDLMKSQSYTNTDLKLLQRQKRDANRLETKINQLDEESVLNQCDVTKLDWLKISKVDLKSNWSSNECQLVWENVCHPRINQQKWTSTEDKQLIDLARKYKEKNWKQISQELGTNRSAFLCIKRYHEKTADKYCKRDWSNEESQQLCQLAEQHRIGLYVPYNYLCYLNGTRDRNNIYNFHLKVDPNLNHGKWSPSEEQAFEEALQFYNSMYNWQEISEYIGTRTSFQCKDRYELKYCNPDKYINWTQEEDKKLLECYNKFENQWVKIANYAFPNRNDNACLHRYTKLTNWHQQNLWFDKQPNEIKEFIMFLCKKNRADTKPDLYTEDGELVPKRPVFSQNLGNIIHKIYEKKDLVYEFVRKMRQGQLSLTLLNKIGVYTHALNMIIKKYQKHHQNQSLKPLESIKKIKAKLNAVTSLKSIEKKPSLKIKKDCPPRKRNHISGMLLHRLDDNLSNHTSLNDQLKLYQSISINLIKNNKIKNSKSKSVKGKKGNYKISELLDLNIETAQTTNSEITDSVTQKVVKERKKRARSTANVEKEPKAKKVKPVQTVVHESTEITALKELKLNQLESKRSTQSPLVVQFDTIPDGEKIPCIIEQSAMFKFMYSLRKENNNSKYFFKYSIINWNGMFVAIKPYTGQVTQEYLTENRLKAIDLALKPVLNILKKSQ